MNEATPDELALRCSACGATLPVPEVASVRCPSCGHVDRIDGALLGRILAHEQALASAAREQAHADEYALGAGLSRSFGNGWALVFVVSWLLAGLVALPGTWWAQLLALTVFIGPFVVLARRVRGTEAQLRGELAARGGVETRVEVVCPTCGGRNALAPGDATRDCGYCGGALVAGARAMEGVETLALDDAARARRHARHEGWRAAAHGQVDPRTDLVPLILFGFLGGMVVLGALMTSLRYLVAGEPELVGVLRIDAVALVITVGLAIPIVARRRWSRAWDRALEDLADRTGGRRQRRLGALAEWLVAHWPGELSRSHLTAGRGYACLLAGDEGASRLWALSAAPFALSEGPGEPHLRVFVPGDPSSPLVLDRAAAFSALGFDCELGEAGLVATADNEAGARLLDPAQRAALVQALVQKPAQASGPRSSTT